MPSAQSATHRIHSMGDHDELAKLLAAAFPDDAERVESI
jgi:hypothetical protein